VKGAVQFLQIERAEGRSLDDQAQFPDLIEGEVSRIERLLERYRRLGRMQAAGSPRDPNDVVRRTAAARRGDAPLGVAVRTELDDTLTASPLDADLVATALDNLVANAFEAMPSGGDVTLSTGSEAGYVWIAVTDRGAGMDARTREQAFDEFYTTKASGSGLGLPFVRRVAEAHGGSVEIESRMGEGTVVKMLFPIN
jgi:signal transduction histidine kinase